jgi:hypothetical protein
MISDHGKWLSGTVFEFRHPLVIHRNLVLRRLDVTAVMMVGDFTGMTPTILIETICAGIEDGTVEVHESDDVDAVCPVCGREGLVRRSVLVKSGRVPAGADLDAVIAARSTPFAVRCPEHEYRTPA